MAHRAVSAYTRWSRSDEAGAFVITADALAKQSHRSSLGIMSFFGSRLANP